MHPVSSRPLAVLLILLPIFATIHAGEVPLHSEVTITGKLSYKDGIFITGQLDGQQIAAVPVPVSADAPLEQQLKTLALSHATVTLRGSFKRDPIDATRLGTELLFNGDRLIKQGG